MISPFGRVGFLEMFGADVMTSLVKVFTDLAWSTCIFFTGEWLNVDFNIVNPDDGPANTADTCGTSFGYTRVVVPVLCALPLWFRFHQCLRRYKDTNKRFPVCLKAEGVTKRQNVKVKRKFDDAIASIDQHTTASDGRWLKCLKCGARALKTNMRYWVNRRCDSVTVTRSSCDTIAYAEAKRQRIDENDKKQ